MILYSSARLGDLLLLMLDVIVGFEQRTLAQSLSDEAVAVTANLATADAREGMMAFMEKRRPVFNQ